MRRRHKPAPLEVPDWARVCVIEHWDAEGDVVRALLLWLSACNAWEERERIPVGPAWEGEGKVFGPFPAVDVPDVSPPPESVIRGARAELRSRKSRRHLDAVKE